jgi:RNA polymerase sigma-70 factor (ECF subfamily)
MPTERSLTRYARDLHSPDAQRREEAARQIWLRFAERLGAVVRHRLNSRILRHAGLDDVLQSLFASFFAAAPGPNGPPRNRAELWKLLICFTMRKVANTAHHDHAQRRDIRRERPLVNLAADTASAGRANPEPEDFRTLSPEDEAIAREEFDRLLAVLPEDLKQVFAMRLEGYTNSEIAEQIGRVERTVELRMRVIRGLLRPYVKVGPPTQP